MDLLISSEMSMDAMMNSWNCLESSGTYRMTHAE